MGDGQWLQKYVIGKAGETHGSRTALSLNFDYFLAQNCINL